jgi:TolB-like protein
LSFCVLFAGFVLFPGAAQTKQQLAILPFTGGEGEDGETIAELFSYDPELNRVFSPLPRTSIRRAIEGERNFQMKSGMTDPDTIAALGKELGAQYVAAGNIATLGNNKLLVVSIIKIDDLQQVAGDLQTYNNIEEIQKKLPVMARNIVQAVGVNRENLPRMSILPFQLRESTNEKDADVLSSILAMYLIKNGRYAIYPRTSSLEQVQKEYDNQLYGDTADDSVAAIGKGVNPRYVLSGAARKLGTTGNMFNASIIDLESGVQVNGGSQNYQSLDDGIKAMEVLAAGLSVAGEEKAAWTAEQERQERAREEAAEKEARRQAAMRPWGIGGGFTLFLNFGIQQPAPAVAATFDSNLALIPYTFFEAGMSLGGMSWTPKSYESYFEISAWLNLNYQWETGFYCGGGLSYLLVKTADFDSWYTEEEKAEIEEEKAEFEAFSRLLGNAELGVKFERVFDISLRTRFTLDGLSSIGPFFKFYYYFE